MVFPLFCLDLEISTQRTASLKYKKHFFFFSRRTSCSATILMHSTKKKKWNKIKKYNSARLLHRLVCSTETRSDQTESLPDKWLVNSLCLRLDRSFYPWMPLDPPPPPNPPVLVTCWARGSGSPAATTGHHGSHLFEWSCSASTDAKKCFVFCIRGRHRACSASHHAAVTPMMH